MGQDALTTALERAFSVPADPRAAFTKEGMALTELRILEELSREAKTVLEVGMAHGTSTIALALNGAHVTSIDPGQMHYYRGLGVEHVSRSGLSARHVLMEEHDYTALPKLLATGVRYDLIFIDGWHSTDYVMLDLFYADLLLRDGGTLVLHDTNAPPVYNALRFLERAKPYTRIGPAPYVEVAGTRRALRRLLHGFGNRARDRRARQERWRTLAAYRKDRTEVAAQYPDR